jgi:hypothetical protein
MKERREKYWEDDGKPIGKGRTQGEGVGGTRKRDEGRGKEVADDAPLQDPMNSKKKAKVEAPLQIPKKASSQNPPVLEMDRHSQGNGQETEEWEGGAESGGRHRKYDLVAKAPWRGGEVKPYLYGRKVVFVLQGERGEPITR